MSIGIKEKIGNAFFPPTNQAVAQKQPALSPALFCPSTSPPPSLTQRAAVLSGSGIGFENAGANCWCNALLQLMFRNDFFCKMYQRVATHYIEHADKNQGLAGTRFLKALTSFQEEMQKPSHLQSSLPSTLSQDVRLAFRTLRNSFSEKASRHEDAVEAFTILADCYTQIPPAPENLPLTFGLVRTFFYYLPNPDTALPAIEKDSADYISFHDPGVKQLFNNLYIREEQIPQTHLAVSICIDSSDVQTLLNFSLSDEIVKSSSRIVTQKGLQHCTRSGGSSYLASAPQELVITLKRFNEAIEKILTPVTPSLELEVREKNGVLVKYTLSGVIVHRGSSARAGHYVFLKRENDRWIEYNDSSVNMLPGGLDEILRKKDVLTGGYLFHYTREV